MLMEIRKKSQITIPKEILKQIGLKVGDKVDISTKDGKLVIEPMRVIAIPIDEEYIWDKEIISEIREGISDYKTGKLKGYKSTGEMFEDLEK